MSDAEGFGGFRASDGKPLVDFPAHHPAIDLVLGARVE
jgi:hypothetical protein